MWLLPLPTSAYHLPNPRRHLAATLATDSAALDQVYLIPSSVCRHATAGETLAEPTAHDCCVWVKVWDNPRETVEELSGDSVLATNDNGFDTITVGPTEYECNRTV